MGLELAIAATVAQGAFSVAETIQQRKAVKQQTKTNAQIERRNTVQRQLDLQHNQGVERANRAEAVQEAAFRKREILRQGRRARAQKVAQLGRQGVAFGAPSLDAVLADQMLEEQRQVSELKFQQAQFTSASRGRTRAHKRDEFAIGEVGRTNVETIRASGRNRRRALGLSAIGRGLSTVGRVGTLSTFRD